jgi:hypothetical protein
MSIKKAKPTYTRENVKDTLDGMIAIANELAGLRKNISEIPEHLDSLWGMLMDIERPLKRIADSHEHTADHVRK